MQIFVHTYTSLHSSDGSVSNYAVFGRFRFFKIRFRSVPVLHCTGSGFENTVSVSKRGKKKGVDFFREIFLLHFLDDLKKLKNCLMVEPLSQNFFFKNRAKMAIKIYF